MFIRILPRFLVFALTAALMLLLAGLPASAAGEDVTVTFAAAAASTYDHASGGGAFTGPSNGTHTNALEGTDFACGDTVSYFNVVTVSAAAAGGPHSLEVTNTFAADAGGVGFTDIMNIVIDAGDPGQLNDGGSQIGVIGFGVDADGAAPFFDDGDVLSGGGDALFATFVVDDLDPGEVVVVRIDARIECTQNAAPSGDLTATLASAGVVADATGGISFDPASGGVQVVALANADMIDRSGVAAGAPEELPLTGDGSDLAALLAVAAIGAGMIALGAAYRRGVGVS